MSIRDDMEGMRVDVQREESESCNHDETHSDGTTRFCSDCGAETHWIEPDSDWHDGPVPQGMWWTEDGWARRG